MDQFKYSTRFTPYFFTIYDIAAIDKALGAIKSRELGDKIVYQQYADKYNVSRSTLSRRHRGVSRSRADYTADKQSLALHQELELVRYITKLTKQGIPPTREMIRNFSSEVAHQQLSESWVTRFINRHEIYLISKWTSAMDRTRHLADSEPKYRL
ncbi:HTH Tnp Tc5 domain containing protein [Pyrenophora teres f. teres]|uniref:HTH Tnp Tc5 domain containing protein n=1 Tax=Pyrenophora teres f. teres TaxID=97479 RepID=A0A6S6VQM2_9PLEO|nr:HTH Tnp Tc5 domain containing protein [Pyrenophora teres f. teres]